MWSLLGADDSPMVREITFQNGEALTEEGLPFLILFYDPNNLTP
jgi:endoplasmic reticulum resident protein 44